MHGLDREGTGKRIRQIRLASGLRQWELARMLGTTQSAVHKYEHGVVPEPRRLIELARIGGTSIEWVLTGRHWENGSQNLERLSPEILNTACLLREISTDKRGKIDEALRIVREAVRTLHAEPQDVNGRCLCAGLRDMANETLQLLESASRIHHSVISTIARETERRLDGVNGETETELPAERKAE